MSTRVTYHSRALVHFHQTMHPFSLQHLVLIGVLGVLEQLYPSTDPSCCEVKGRVNCGNSHQFSVNAVLKNVKCYSIQVMTNSWGFTAFTSWHDKDAKRHVVIIHIFKGSVQRRVVDTMTTLWDWMMLCCSCCWIYCSMLSKAAVL